MIESDALQTIDLLVFMVAGGFATMIGREIYRLSWNRSLMLGACFVIFVMAFCIIGMQMKGELTCSPSARVSRC